MLEKVSQRLSSLKSSSFSLEGRITFSPVCFNSIAYFSSIDLHGRELGQEQVQGASEANVVKSKVRGIRSKSQVLEIEIGNNPRVKGLTE